MIMDIEHRFLVELAERCKRRGLSPAEAYDSLQEDLRGFSSSGPIRCAVSAVFEHPDHSAAIF